MKAPTICVAGCQVARYHFGDDFVILVVALQLVGFVNEMNITIKTSYCIVVTALCRTVSLHLQ